MGWGMHVTECGELATGKCSCLVELKFSPQSLPHLALASYELYRASQWMVRNGEVDVFSVEEAVCNELVG